MSRRVAGLACTVLVGASILLAADPESENKPKDRWPRIRRILATSSEESQRWQKSGRYTELPLAEFEQLWQRARSVTPAPSEQPRLNQANYHAVLLGDTLVGSATWRFAAGTQAAWVALPLGLPAWSGTAEWQNQEPPRFVSTAENAVQLQLPALADPRLRFGWEVQGIVEGESRRFELRLPASPSGVFVLHLPRRWALAAADPSVTALQLHEGSLLRSWQLVWNSQTGSPLRFLVVPEKPLLQQPAPWQVQSQYDLEADGATVRTTLRCTSPCAESLVLAIDPELQVQEIRQLNPSRTLPWKPPSDGRLTLSLPQSDLRDPLLEVTGFLRTAKAGAPLTLAGVRPAKWGYTEQLQVRALPGQTALWQLDLPRLSAPRLEPTALGNRETWHLNLSDTHPTRPVLRAQALPPEIAGAEACHWCIGPRRQQLLVHLACRALRGTPSMIKLELPRGYLVESVKVEPTGLLSSHTVALSGESRYELRLDLRSPLPATQATHVEIVLGTKESEPTWPLPLTAPRLEWSDTRIHERSLGISVQRVSNGGRWLPRFAVIREGPWGCSCPIPSEMPPWPEQAATPTDGCFAPAAGGGEARLQLDPVRAEGQFAVATVHIGKQLRYRVTAVPVLGESRQVDVRFTQPPPALAWRVRQGRNRIIRYERLDELNYRVVLADVLASPVTFEATGTSEDGRHPPKLTVVSPGVCRAADPTEVAPAEPLAPAPGTAAAIAPTATTDASSVREAWLAASFVIFAPLAFLVHSQRRTVALQFATYLILVSSVSACQVEGPPAESVEDVLILPSTAAAARQCLVPRELLENLRKWAFQGDSAVRFTGRATHLLDRQGKVLRWEINVPVLIAPSQQRPATLHWPAEAPSQIYASGRPVRFKLGTFQDLQLQDLTVGNYELRMIVEVPLIELNGIPTARFAFAALPAQTLEWRGPADQAPPSFLADRLVSWQPMTRPRFLQAELGSLSHWQLQWPASESHQPCELDHSLMRLGTALMLRTDVTLPAGSRQPVVLSLPQSLRFARLEFGPPSAGLRLLPGSVPERVLLERSTVARAACRCTLWSRVSEEALLADWRQQWAIRTSALIATNHVNFLVTTATLAQATQVLLKLPTSRPAATVRFSNRLPAGDWHAAARALSSPVSANWPSVALGRPSMVRPVCTIRSEGRTRAGSLHLTSRLIVQPNSPEPPPSLQLQLPKGLEVSLVEGDAVRGWSLNESRLRVELFASRQQEINLTIRGEIRWRKRDQQHSVTPIPRFSPHDLDCPRQILVLAPWQGWDFRVARASLPLRSTFGPLGSSWLDLTDGTEEDELVAQRRTNGQDNRVEWKGIGKDRRVVLLTKNPTCQVEVVVENWPAGMSFAALEAGAFQSQLVQQKEQQCRWLLFSSQPRTEWEFVNLPDTTPRVTLKDVDCD